MEQFNKVQLRGIVGSVRSINMGDRKGTRITVATNLAYRGQDGCCVIETTWHNVYAWEGKGIHDLDKLEKGAQVEITGRLKNQRYLYSSMDSTAVAMEYYEKAGEIFKKHSWNESCAALFYNMGRPYATRGNSTWPRNTTRKVWTIRC